MARCGTSPAGKVQFVLPVENSEIDADDKIILEPDILTAGLGYYIFPAELHVLHNL